MQGGSTITQQLVKNVYAGQYEKDPKTGVETYAVPPRTLGQKVRESLLAIKVEREFTKDEILAKYLNTVYFGRGAYGVQAAAQTFFQKDASELSALESALLAGMIQSPSYYDPVEQEDAALERRNYVLEQMASEGYLTAERAAAARGPADQGEPDRGRPELPRQARLLPRLHAARPHRRVHRGAVFGGGLQVTTTLDPQMQRYAEQAVANRLDTPGDPAAALVAIDPRTGGVRGDVRREELQRVEGEPRDRRRRFGPPGGLGVQAVHARHRDRAGLLAGLALVRPRHDHDPRPRLLHGRRAVGALEREPTRRAASSRCCRPPRTR